MHRAVTITAGHMWPASAHEIVQGKNRSPLQLPLPTPTGCLPAPPCCPILMGGRAGGRKFPLWLSSLGLPGPTPCSGLLQADRQGHPTGRKECASVRISFSTSCSRAQCERQCHPVSPEGGNVPLSGGLGPPPCPPIWHSHGCLGVEVSRETHHLQLLQMLAE